MLVGDDQPRKCTGRRLVRLGLAREVHWPPVSGERPVALDPYASVPLTRKDLPRATTDGLLAVDCSWNRLAEQRARAAGSNRSDLGPEARRLPLLVASNPQHFGRLGELNTAEALGAALYLLGRPAEAARLLAGFAGGPTFLELNRARLARYARATSPEELVREERALFTSS